jgi:hypothetical protein
MRLKGWLWPLAMLCLPMIGCAPRSSAPSVLPWHDLDWGRGQSAAHTSTVGPTVVSPDSGSRAAPAGGEWSDISGSREWRYIVVHHSASEVGNAAIFDAEHRHRGWEELGYHFVIDNGSGGPDGRVEIGPRWRTQKWGAHTGRTPGNEYNNHGIGICLVGDFSRHAPSRAQLASLNRLVCFLAAKYGIPAENIIGHRDAPGAHTECPGDCLYSYVHSTLRASVR